MPLNRVYLRTQLKYSPLHQISEMKNSYSMLLKLTKHFPFFRSCCNGNSNHFTVSTIDWKNQGSVIPQPNAAIKRRKEEKSTRSTQLGNRRILNSLIHQISNFFKYFDFLSICRWINKKQPGLLKVFWPVYCLLGFSANSFGSIPA